jgi:hypothetical protein
MRNYLRMLAGMFIFGGLAIGAKAQVVDQIDVKVPYSFKVGDKTLPAGNYRVNRVSFENQNELVLSSVENKTGVLVVSSETEVVHESMPKLIFEDVGGEHLLVKIQTDEHVFSVPVSHTAILLATAKAHPGTAGSASGTD